MGARSVSSAQYRDRGLKMSARPKAAGQASPRNECYEIHPRAPELQAREEQDQNEEEELPSTRAPEREQDENEEQDQDGEKELPSTRDRESEPPMYVSFITRVCKYLDHRSPVGGATPAHWSGEKGGVNLPGSRHLHTRFSLSLDERLVEEESAALLGDDGRQEVEEER